MIWSGQQCLQQQQQKTRYSTFPFVHFIIMQPITPTHSIPIKSDSSSLSITASTNIGDYYIAATASGQILLFHAKQLISSTILCNNVPITHCVAAKHSLSEILSCNIIDNECSAFEAFYAVFLINEAAQLTGLLFSTQSHKFYSFFSMKLSTPNTDWNNSLGLSQDSKCLSIHTASGAVLIYSLHYSQSNETPPNELNNIIKEVGKSTELLSWNEPIQLQLILIALIQPPLALTQQKISTTLATTAASNTATTINSPAALSSRSASKKSKSKAAKEDKPVEPASAAAEILMKVNANTQFSMTNDVENSSVLSVSGVFIVWEDDSTVYRYNLPDKHLIQSHFVQQKPPLAQKTEISACYNSLLSVKRTVADYKYELPSRITCITTAHSNLSSNVAIGLANGEVYIYSTATSSFVRDVAFHSSSIISLKWFNSNCLLSASEDNTIKTHNIEESSDKASTHKFSMPIQCIAHIFAAIPLALLLHKNLTSFILYDFLSNQVIGNITAPESTEFQFIASTRSAHSSLHSISFSPASLQYYYNFFSLSQLLLAIYPAMASKLNCNLTEAQLNLHAARMFLSVLHDARLIPTAFEQSNLQSAVEEQSDNALESLNAKKQQKRINDPLSLQGRVINVINSKVKNKEAKLQRKELLRSYFEKLEKCAAAEQSPASRQTRSALASARL
jgi:hypothetical protein